MGNTSFSQTCFNNSALVIAPWLLGKIVTSHGVSLQILETEAYLHNDTACHAYNGETPRNKPMFGPAGHLYIYLCYGIHNLVNIVTGNVGEAQAVLIRAGLVVGGHECAKGRRGAV